MVDDDIDDLLANCYADISQLSCSSARDRIKARDATIRSDRSAKYRACVEALEPFAEMSDAIGMARPSIHRETDNVYGFEKAVLTLGDFHRARKAIDELRAALAGLEEK